MDPPRVQFVPPLYHPNLFDNGEVCLSILKSEKDYKASITLSQLLVGLQSLLIHPNNDDPAHREASMDYRNNMEKYEQKVRAQAARFKRKDDDDDDD